MKFDIKTLQNEIAKFDTLPTVPSSLKKILAVLENPKTSLLDIGTLILNDPVLTSRVLKIANSAIYGFPGRISTINQALLLLGLNIVRGLLLGVSVFEAMQKTMHGLWEHSINAAVAARDIAIMNGLKEPEEVSVAALLHDIGKVIFSLKFPSDYQNVLEKVNTEGIFIFEAEKAIFGITHAEAAAWVARKWNFPFNLVEAIEYHHKPELSKNVPMHTAIVHISDILVRARGHGFAGDNFVPPVNYRAWDMVNLSEADIKEIFIHMEDSLQEAESLDFSDG